MTPFDSLQLGRRRFLQIASISAAGLLAGCGDRSGAGWAGEGNRGRLDWSAALRVPPLDEGRVENGVRVFDLTAAAGTSEFRRGVRTPTWGFNGAYLGPTLRAARGERVRVDVHNELDETTTVHWHGMRLPAVMDGTPHQPVEPAAVWSPTWTIEQPAATLWYHPHPHGATAAHVYRGLSGMWIVDDPETDDMLPNEYGIDDVPLVIQDRDLGGDGTLREDRSNPFWGLLGNDILVNGSFGPHFVVTTRLVRFRILNGSNARVYNLRFDDARQFHVVATDCGLLASPVVVDEVTVSPGERVEVLVEFEARQTRVLTSRPRGHGIDDGEFDIVQLRAADALLDNGSVPGELPGPAAIELPSAATHREFILAGDARINSKEMDMARIDVVVPVGSVEEWEVWAPGVPHNFHIHDAAFTILEVDGRPPPAHAQGLKDTVFLPSDARARLAVRFGEYPDPHTPYMFHCHILRHEDKGMMGQFTIVEPGSEDTAPRRIEVGASHDH